MVESDAATSLMDTKEMTEPTMIMSTIAVRRRHQPWVRQRRSSTTMASVVVTHGGTGGASQITARVDGPYDARITSGIALSAATAARDGELGDGVGCY